MAAAAIPLITTGISALSGLFGGKKQQKSTTTSDGTINSSNTFYNNPVLSNEQSSLIHQFTQGLMDQYNQNTDLSGYTGAGLRQINSNADASSKMANNILAARGLSHSPYAGFVNVANNNQRLSQSADFLNSIPLLQRQLKQQALQQMIQGAATIPYGQSGGGTQNATTHQTSETVGSSPGGGLPGLFSGLGAGLAAPANGSGQTNASVIGGALSKAFGIGGSYNGV